MVTRVSEQLNTQNNSASIRSMWGTIFYNAKVYDLVGDGSTNDYTDLYNLINTTINGAEATIIFPKGTYKISSNITIPSNVSLYFVKGAMLSPDSGKTITINGPVEAGLWKIFTGSGTIAGNPKVEWFYSQWWGAKGDGTTDDTTSIQSAITAAGVNGGTVFFPYTSTYYKISAALLVPSNVSLLGDSSKPKIKQTGAGTSHATGAVVMNSNYGSGSNTNINIYNLTLENQYQTYLTPGTNIPAYLYGILFGEVTNFRISNCYILNCISESIYVGATSGSSVDGIISNNRIENGCASGIAITNGKKIRVVDNYLFNTNVFGIDVEPNTGCVGEDIIIQGNHIDTVRADYFKNSTTIGKINGNGISIQAGSLPDQTRDIVVIANTVRNVAAWTSGLGSFGSIVCVNALRTTIEANIVESSQSCGITVRSGSSSIIVSKNHVRNSTDKGINITDTCSYINVDGNIVETSTNGIQATTTVKYLNIVNNVVINPNTTGILVQGATSSDILISNNRCLDTRSGGSRTMQYGIRISSGCDKVVVSSNMIYNSTSDQVRDADGSTNTMQLGNMEDANWRIKNANYHLFSDGFMYNAQYRSGSATPVGAITPRFIGEEYRDTSAVKWYKSTGLTTADWVALN